MRTEFEVVEQVYKGLKACPIVAEFLMNCNENDLSPINNTVGKDIIDQYSFKDFYLYPDQASYIILEKVREKLLNDAA